MPRFQAIRWPGWRKAAGRAAILSGDVAGRQTAGHDRGLRVASLWRDLFTGQGSDSVNVINLLEFTLNVP